MGDSLVFYFRGGEKTRIGIVDDTGHCAVRIPILWLICQLYRSPRQGAGSK